MISFTFNVLITLLLTSRLSQAKFVNVTVDDQQNSPQLTWNQDANNLWHPSSSHPNKYFNGTLMMSEDPGSQAQFEFTGRAIYYIAPLWPKNMTVVLRVDDFPEETVDLRDYAEAEANSNDQGTAPSQKADVRWSKQGMRNVYHKLVIKPGNTAIVDAFRYTTDNPGSINDDGTGNSTEEGPSTGVIIGSVVGGVSGGILLSLFAFFLLRRNRKRKTSQRPNGLDKEIGIATPFPVQFEGSCPSFQISEASSWPTKDRSDFQGQARHHRPTSEEVAGSVFRLGAGVPPAYASQAT